MKKGADHTAPLACVERLDRLIGLALAGERARFDRG